MSSKGEADIKDSKSILEKITLALGIVSPRDHSVGEMSEALGCMRLWFAIRTDDGRKRALECLSLIVEDEQR
ncbi:hypothetical protein [Methylobacterium frigidaeris]|jgi:hypothetical protein|uniref:hypothetical protein n=1 Tax=Methylobacterium frigidaeris TaxID=2038277 RepID=UPI001EDEE1E6|nr:hypothetical protein [Methylobacterium frigidaeris]